MELLERAPQLEELSGLLREASRGPGLLALVPGEAGMGKSVFVQQFAHRHADSAKVLTGRCESLSTPRPLAPLADIALQAGGELERQITGEDRAAAFTGFLEFLRQAKRPIAVILEDLHWADDATLDLLRFVTRRLSRVRVLVIGTYRDDEVGPRHPLRVALGDLATSGALRRISLRPFSRETVAALAEERGFDGGELLRRTGGNPFFVTEVLAGSREAIPETVRDAVLARAARLSSSARRTLDAAAVVGSVVDTRLLAAVEGSSSEAIEECLNSGLLQATERLLTFRHELAREAVYGSLPPHVRLSLHGLVLEALRAEPTPDVASLAHHAELADDREAVLQYARLAGERAVLLGSHREAGAQYRRAIRVAAALPDAEKAELFEKYAGEVFLTADSHAALEAQRTAVRLWRKLENRLREGAALTALSNMLVAMGDNRAAEQASLGAIDLLERLAPGPELALAYSGQAGLRMLDRDNDEAIEWGQKAISLAEEFSSADALVGALNRVGSAMLLKGEEAGRHFLVRSLELAQEAGRDDLVAVAYSNLGSGAGELYEFRRAIDYLEAGIAFALENDLDSNRFYMLSWLALSYLYLGRWSEATEAASEVLAHRGAVTISRIMALVALARVRARRGDPDVWPVLDEALELAAKTGTLQRLAPVHAARAEAAWFEGNLGRCAEDLRGILELADRHQHSWFTGEMCRWLQRSGENIAPPDWVAEPFALELKGEWEAAHRAWSARECPFEAAQALAASAAEEHLRLALSEFERLGARPAASLVSARLREMGVRGVPRGPRPSTRRNPAGLTKRELEVLALLSEGLSNGDIAESLHLSVRTVGHHVSAILGKLEVGNRTEAVSVAVSSGIVSRPTAN